MSRATEIAEKLVARTLKITTMVMVLLVAYCFLAYPGGRETLTGDFSAESFNDGWQIFLNDEKIEDVTIPTVVDEAERDDVIKMVRTLPDDIHDGMSLMVRTDMEDISVSVDGALKVLYSADTAGCFNYYTTSAYTVVELSSNDAGKQIEIELGVKEKGIINDIRLSNGNNAWFNIIYTSAPLNVFSIIMIVLGILAMITFIFIKGKVSDNYSVLYLGLVMADIGIWMVSESKIRQLFMTRPSMSSIFSYLSIETLAAFVLLYFDAVQHKHYHRVNVILETGVCVQLLVNTVLHAFGILYYHDTLFMSHIWMAAGIIVTASNVIRDVHSGQIKQYINVAWGIVLFVVLAACELINYYRDDLRVSGVYICVGLLLLLTGTIIQMVYDIKTSYQKKEDEQARSVIMTLETIANAIDAKDEYTGGHSYRVGCYVSALAREMAPDYGFTEEDIVRINYIGLLHDIGKIGVADPILNKAGKLTNEEFQLIKKHVDIGYELLSNLGNSVEGLLDGIRYHHERFDGRGYPDGLSGKNIPLIARMLCIADCYDAMTSNRVYRKRISDDEVRTEFIRCRGSQYDPELVDIFIKILDRGDVKPITVDGIGTDKNGKILRSSALENRVSADLRNGEITISNPEHVRMMCYILKLVENKGLRVDVVFIRIEEKQSEETQESNVDNMAALIGPFLRRHDIDLEYTGSEHVIAFMDRTDEEMELLIKSIEGSEGVSVTVL